MEDITLSAILFARTVKTIPVYYDMIEDLQSLLPPEVNFAVRSNMQEDDKYKSKQLNFVWEKNFINSPFLPSSYL